MNKNKNELQTTHVVLLEADERRSLAEAATADHEAVLANQALVRTADAAARASERRSETEQISVTQRNATTSRRKRHAPSRHAAQRPHRRNAATLTTRGCPCQSCGDAASRASALRGARSAQNAAKTKKKTPQRRAPSRRARRRAVVRHARRSSLVVPLRPRVTRRVCSRSSRASPLVRRRAATRSFGEAKFCTERASDVVAPPMTTTAHDDGATQHEHPVKLTFRNDSVARDVTLV